MACITTSSTPSSQATISYTTSTSPVYDTYDTCVASSYISYNYDRDVSQTLDAKTIKSIPTIISAEIADVQIEYETVKDIIVNSNERDDKGNYKVEKKITKKPVKVIVVFKNGDIQHAVCHKDDEFDFEIGISICIMKELLHFLGVKNPTKTYNDLIKIGVAVYNEKQKFIQELQKQEEAKKIREASKQRRRQRKAAKKKEREIEILAEAIRRSRISENTNK